MLQSKSEIQIPEYGSQNNERDPDRLKTRLQVLQKKASRSMDASISDILDIKVVCSCNVFTETLVLLELGSPNIDSRMGAEMVSD